MNRDYMLRFDGNLQRHTNALITLLNMKHSKYGNEPINKTGLMGLITKLDIKIERLRNLEAEGAWKTSDLNTDEMREEVFEQLVDIAGYGLLGIMWLRGQLK